MPQKPKPSASPQRSEGLRIDADPRQVAWALMQKPKPKQKEQ